MLISHLRKAEIPPLYGQEDAGENATAHIKIKALRLNWTWYITEFDGDDLCFGLIIGDYTEFGYFRVSELIQAIPFIDTSYKPKTIRQIRQEL